MITAGLCQPYLRRDGNTLENEHDIPSTNPPSHQGHQSQDDDEDDGYDIFLPSPPIDSGSSFDSTSNAGIHSDIQRDNHDHEHTTVKTATGMLMDMDMDMDIKTDTSNHNSNEQNQQNQPDQKDQTVQGTS